MTTEQGNIRIFQTDDGGAVEIVGGIFSADGGLASMAYLALFGGNEEDDGREGNPRTWWGNLSETVEAHRYVSRTEELLARCPPIPASLRKIEDAAKRDLQDFTAEGIASSVSVAASMPGVNSVRIAVTIEAEGDSVGFAFVLNWRDNA